MDLGYKIIAVDFDGTLCTNKWPEIGDPNLPLIEYLKKQQNLWNKVILWTCRTENLLVDAIAWCASYGLYFNEVNRNVSEVITKMDGDSRKIFAHEYIDDRAVSLDEFKVNADREKAKELINTISAASRSLINLNRQAMIDSKIYKDIDVLEKVSGYSMSTLTRLFLEGYRLEKPEECKTEVFLEDIKEINRYIVDNPNRFIKFWNDTLNKYGVVTLYDVKYWMWDPSNKPIDKDMEVGWTKEITTDNFVEIEISGRTYYQLKLPEMKQLV